MNIIHAERAQTALELIRPHLVAAGAEGELIYGMLNELSSAPEVWGKRVTMLIGVEEDAPIAFVIRTGNYPAVIVGFVDEQEIDFQALVREMQRIDHVPTSVNGAVRCSVPFAEAWAAETGYSLETMRELRAFELHHLRPPSNVGGSARVARVEDADLLEPWCEGFGRDIGEPLEPGHAEPTVTRFVTNEDMMLWITEDGPVSMAAISRRTPSSSCISWVYTPVEHRRRGYAGAVVAALSQRELDAEASWCSLFTDLENPTSNHIYAELGYEPRCDHRHIGLVSA